MTRLPKVGGDAGNWGRVLNSYLLTEHDHEGGHHIKTMLSVPAQNGQFLVSDTTGTKGVGWRRLAKQDVGLDNIDNTSDIDKPVSIAQQAVLDQKLATTGGTVTGAIDMSAHNVVNLAVPQDPQDAATKDYVDTQTAVALTPKVGAGAKRSPATTFSVYDPLETGWSDPYSRGTVSIDTSVYFEGVSALKIVTNVSGGVTDYCGATKSMSGDWSKKSFRLAVRAVDWSSVSAVMIDISTSGSFTAFYTAAISQSTNLAHPANNEWIEIVIPRASFSVGAGTPNWATVNAVTLKAVAKTGQQATVWIDGFAAYDDAARGICSIVFDDGKLTHYTNAKPYMDKYGFRGTAFVIPSSVGGGSHMSQDQLDEMHVHGWDIAGHSSTNLITLTPEQRSTELRVVKSYLVDRGYRGADIYAYPDSATNDAVKSEVGKLFSYARTVENLGQPRSYVVPHYIQAKNIFEGLGSISYIQGLINNARDNGEWLVMLFHEVLPTATGANISQTKFNQIIDYLYASGIEVVPMSEALEKRAVKWGDVAGDITISEASITNCTYDRLNDVNGNRALNIVSSVNAVNYLSAVNSSANSPPALRSDGTDANIDIHIQSKGTGAVKLRSNVGLTIANFNTVAAPANYIIASNAAAGNAPYIQSAGTDTNVGLSLRPKNGGPLYLDGAIKTRRTAVYNTNYTIALSDHIVAFATLTTGRTATLPDPSLVTGVSYIIKDESGTAGSNTITVVAASGNIDGAPSRAIASSYGSLRLYSDGANWFTVT